MTSSMYILFQYKPNFHHVIQSTTQVGSSWKKWRSITLHITVIVCNMLLYINVSLILVFIKSLSQPSLAVKISQK